MKFSELTFRAHLGGLWPPNPSSESSLNDKCHRPLIVLGNGEKKLTCLFFASNSFLHPKFVDLGLGHFWGFPTSGGGTPDLIDGHYSPWDHEKNSFCSGGIGAHLGEICSFEFLQFWRFWAFNGDFLEDWSSDFHEIFTVDRLTGDV